MQEILIDRVRRVRGCLTDDKQGGFREGREGVRRSDLHTKADRRESKREKNVVYVGFINLEKAYDRVYREVLWHILRMYVAWG